MFVKLLICTILLFSGVFAEPPASQSGPYAASGWRPQRPFNLPGGIQPPVEIQQRPTPQMDLEITKARIDYIGQFQDNNLKANQRQPQYIVPDFLKVQELPSQNTQQPYRPPPQQQFTPRTPNAEQPQTQPSQPPRKPTFPADSPQTTVRRKPAQKYGSPQTVDFNIVYPDPRSLEEGQVPNGGDVNDFFSAPQNNGPEFETEKTKIPPRQGQYFVLGPDNTLQRVTFTTTQDEEDRRSNGFTAQLKYTPVGELNDPVFRYNNRGQLVRALKKK